MRLISALIIFLAACQPRAELTLADPPPKPIDQDLLPAPATAQPIGDGDFADTMLPRLIIDSEGGAPCAASVDGHPVGRSPVVVVDLSVGEHEVSCDWPDRPYTVRIPVSATEPTHVTFTYVRRDSAE